MSLFRAPRIPPPPAENERLENGAGPINVPRRVQPNIRPNLEDVPLRLRRRRREPIQDNIRLSQQCTSQTLQARRCRKRTAHTGECWIHLAKNKNLRIKPSNIPNAGKGLFTWKNAIPANRKIVDITGRRMSKRALDRKYGDKLARYSLCNGNTPDSRCVDANHTTDAAGRFANSKRGSRYRSNARFKWNEPGNFFYLKSKRRIPANKEIFVNYGQEYWQ